MDRDQLAEVDKFGKNHYNWIHQYIQLNCDNKDINLLSSTIPLTAKGQKNASFLVHEYIHYLQNFATNWGSAICVDLALAYLKVGASSITSAEEYKRPLDREKISNPTLLEGLTIIDGIRARLVRSNRTSEKPEGARRLITASLSNGIVTLSNGILEVQVGTKVIRESMAHMGTCLYLGMNDAKVHANNEQISRKTPSTPPFCHSEEYWIVFEYFFEKDYYPDVTRGIFALMQYALCTMNPEKTVYRFFNHLAAAGPGPTLILIVEAFQLTPSERIVNSIANVFTSHHCKQLEKICLKHRAANDLFQFELDIVQYTIACIATSHGGRIFNPLDAFGEFNYWRNKLTLYGSGLIKFRDRCTINGTKSHCLRMESVFTSLLSVGLVLEKLLRNDILQCPFLYEFDICVAGYKDPVNCHKNPFLVQNPLANGQECEFRNGYLLLGMQNRISF